MKSRRALLDDDHDGALARRHPRRRLRLRLAHARRLRRRPPRRPDGASAADPAVSKLTEKQPAHASLVLERLCRTAGSAAVAHIFGAHPAVLARCVVRAGGTPELEFLDACPTGGACRLVRYRRPNLRRMQLYTLDDQLRLFKAARPGRKQEDFSASIAVDPTRLHIPQGSVFGPETVRQVRPLSAYLRARW